MNNHQSITINFNEPEWLKLLFLLSDTQSWIDEMEKEMIYMLPIDDKKKLFRKTYYITASSLAHILEKHYYKISRHPACGKFTIPVIEIMHWLRQAFSYPSARLPGTLNYIRIINTETNIGFDKFNNPTTIISIITDNGGQIKTAFPGCCLQPGTHNP